MRETLIAPDRTTEETHIQPVDTSGPSIKYVSWEHIPENGPAAANAVRDCDVIAIEYAGFSDDKQRAQYEAAATAFVSTKASDTEKVSAQVYLQSFAPAVLAILGNLKDSDKEIVTFDVNESKSKAKTIQSLQLFEEAEETIHLSSSKRSKKLLHAAAQGLADSVVDRDAKDISQLQQLTAQYEGTDVEIGVLAGANHTRVMHALRKMHPVEHRVVAAQYAGQSSLERLYFPPNIQMARHYTFLPGTEVPEGIVGRALLYQTQVTAIKKGVATNNTIRARRLENLMDYEASELVLTLDGLKSGLRSWLRPRRVLAKMDATIEAKLLEVESTRGKEKQ